VNKNQQCYTHDSHGTVKTCSVSVCSHA